MRKEEFQSSIISNVITIVIRSRDLSKPRLPLLRKAILEPWISFAECKLPF